MSGIATRDLKAFLAAAVEVMRNPELVDKMLVACARSERATERFREAEAELAVIRQEHDRHLAESSRAHAERLRSERQAWDVEQAQRRKRLEHEEYELERLKACAEVRAAKAAVCVAGEAKQRPTAA
jgi:hypothetical protein